MFGFPRRAWDLALPSNEICFTFPHGRPITLQWLAEEELQERSDEEQHDIEFPEASVVTVPKSPEPP